MHGGFGTGEQAERDYNWDAEADGGHFLVAYPDGQGRAWNAGSCCGEPQRTNLDDVGFITAMVSDIEQQIPIDPARVYATGMSNGAMMALRLGCQTDAFAAIAPVAGTLLTDCSNARPTSVLQIHGTADDRVPYNGGPGKAFAANGNPRVDGPSVESVNATWRSIDGCGPPNSTTAGDVTTQIAGCPNGRTVELISVAGAGHQWPGGVAQTRAATARGPSRAVDGAQRHRHHLAVLYPEPPLKCAVGHGITRRSSGPHSGCMSPGSDSCVAVMTSARSRNPACTAVEQIGQLLAAPVGVTSSSSAGCDRRSRVLISAIARSGRDDPDEPGRSLRSARSRSS